MFVTRKYIAPERDGICIDEPSPAAVHIEISAPSPEGAKTFGVNGNILFEGAARKLAQRSPDRTKCSTKLIDAWDKLENYEKRQLWGIPNILPSHELVVQTLNGIERGTGHPDNLMEQLRKWIDYTTYLAYFFEIGLTKESNKCDCSSTRGPAPNPNVPANSREQSATAVTAPRPNISGNSDSDADINDTNENSDGHVLQQNANLRDSATNSNISANSREQSAAAVTPPRPNISGNSRSGHGPATNSNISANSQEQPATAVTAPRPNISGNSRSGHGPAPNPNVPANSQEQPAAADPTVNDDMILDADDTDIFAAPAYEDDDLTNDADIFDHNRGNASNGPTDASGTSSNDDFTNDPDFLSNWGLG
jgi:hypothetical protein